MAVTSTWSALRSVPFLMVFEALTASCGPRTPRGDPRPSLTPGPDVKAPGAAAPSNTDAAPAGKSESAPGSDRAPAVPTPPTADPVPPAAPANNGPSGTVTTGGGVSSGTAAGSGGLGTTSTPDTSGGGGVMPAPPSPLLVVSEGYKKNCAFCHGANGAGGTGRILGPSLVKYDEDFAAYAAAVRSGVKGSAMGAYKATRYSDADLANDFAFFTGKPAL